jgi:glycosyltransferase involved in cell wall biosynthesis
MTKFRIGLDARMERPRRTGLGRYARALCRELTSRNEPDIQWVIIKHPSMVDTPLAAPGAEVEEVLLDGDLDLLPNLWRGGAINALNLDLYHALHHFLPIGLKVPRVMVTLHDLIWVEHAHLTFDTRSAWIRTPFIRLFGSLTMRHAMKRSDAVIAISDATRQAALERYSFLNPEAVTTIHHGVDRARFPARQGPESESPYFFSLGNSKPYKNVRGVIEAFALVAKEHDEVKLVMSGRGDSNAKLDQWAQDLGIRERMDFTGMVSDEEIVALFHGARALVFPSFVEGFGFPLVEAMSLGCPIVASSVPVVQEICRDAAVFADPNEPEAIAEQMSELLTNHELRADLRRRGYARADHFDWARCAATTLSQYKNLLS